MSKQKIFKISIVLFGLLATALCLAAQEYSLYLNGNGQYANCGSSSDFNFTNALTVEAWIYPTDFKEFEHMNTIVAKTIWSNDYSHGWTLRYGSANRTLNFNIGGGTGVTWIDCKADGVLNLNAWQHVAATYDGSDIKLYVNGVLVATKTYSGTIVNANNNLCIGSISHSDMRYMTGRIDEVRIWNVVRTAVEITDNVHHSVTSPNLVAYYKMDGGSGTVLTDDSGNGHTAELIGSPSWTTEPPREYSLELSSPNKYVDCGDNFTFYTNSNLTLEAWIYPTEFGDESNPSTILSRRNTYISPYYWWLGYEGRTLFFQLKLTSTPKTCSADNILSLNTWQHVAVTYDNSSIKLYVNGLLVATESYIGWFSSSSHPNVLIGAVNIYNSLGPYCRLQGNIDEVRIWRSARTASQIADNRFQSVSDSYLMAYYQMSNGAGTRLTDNSGNGRYGNVYGLPTWSLQSPITSTIVSTQSVTPINGQSATANGIIEHIGCTNTVTYGHCWSNTTIYPTITSSYHTSLGPATTQGAYSSVISGLSPNTTYSVRAYATNIVGNEPMTSYGKEIRFNSTTITIPAPLAQPASATTTSSFTANWSGAAWYVPAFFSVASSYSYMMDVSTDSDFRSFVSEYSSVHCGSHDSSLNTTDHSFAVSGLTAGITYYYRVRANQLYAYSPYSATITVTTLSNYNVSYNTGNITGVRIYTAETDYGIDPPSPLVFAQGFSGTILAEKEGYTWSLADGSDSNVILDLASNKSISFIGNYSYEDPAHPGFTYAAEPGIPITVSSALMEDLTVPLPHNASGDAIVLNFSGTAESDITITVPDGIWYIVAYYNDPSDGGLAWHQASPYPASGPQEVVFSNLPFGAKSDIPVIIGSEDATLAVELSSFTAVASANSYVSLSWVTQSETNLLGYAVLRNITSSLSEASGISALIPASNSSQTAIYNFRDMDMASEDYYYYWLQIGDMDGSLTYYGPICVNVSWPGNDNPPVIPLLTRLLPCYPNPFNPSTTINYELKSPERVRISVYSSKGQLVDTYMQDHSTAGVYSWVFQGVDRSGKDLSSGVYFYTMTAGNYKHTQKMVLLK